MNVNQAKTKLKKLKTKLWAIENLPKIVQSLRYASSEEEAKNQIIQFFENEEVQELDWKYLFSLPLREVARFSPIQQTLAEIESCNKVIETKKNKKDTSSLFEE